jgi:hypothetical protein
MDALAFYALYGAVERVDCWNTSYAPGNPTFVAGKLVCELLTGLQQKSSGFSTNSGQTGTWTPYAVSPESFFVSQTGETTHFTGGFICTIDEQNQMCCAGTSRGNQPIFTANQGAGWAFCGLPIIDWWGRYFGYGNQPPGQPFAAGQETNIGSVWALEAFSVVASGVASSATGTAIIHKSSTADLTTWATTYTINNFGAAFTYTSPLIYSVPGYPNDLWVSASFTSSTNAGLWQSTDGGSHFTKLATLPTGMGFPQYFCLGAPLPGKTYPTIYLAMWTIANNFSTTKLFYSTDQGATWNFLGNTGTYVDLPATMSAIGVKAIFGDWQVPGLVYASSNGSGLSYYKML